jgi:hypothetical protein
VEHVAAAEIYLENPMPQRRQPPPQKAGEGTLGHLQEKEGPAAGHIDLLFDTKSPSSGLEGVTPKFLKNRLSLIFQNLAGGLTTARHTKLQSKKTF